MEDVVFRYHEETKHHFHRYARSPGYLDWDTQPNPFRYYEGTEHILLERFPDPKPQPYTALYDMQNKSSRPVDRESISEFFRYAVAVSAWKQSGNSKWALRVDPSSGNLHPTEVYCVLAPSTDWNDRPGVYHYVSERHILEIRGLLTPDLWSKLMIDLPTGAFLVGICSIHWREAWKYGERAFRYCQHDAGHVLATLSLSASLLGWRMRLLEGWSDRAAEAIFGLRREDSGLKPEQETPDFLAVVSPKAVGNDPFPHPCEETLDRLRAAHWFGEANGLSVDHVDWAIIDEASEAACNPGGVRLGNPSLPNVPRPYVEEVAPTVDARKIILQRRSALAYDGLGTISLDLFLRMMHRALPGPHAPWDALYWPPYIHLALFVHRVEDLAPGVYMLVRHTDTQDALRAAMSTDFVWKRPVGVPEGFPLYLLQEGDARQAAMQLSCGQDIAGMSFFSLGMIAEFAGPIRRWGPWFYRNLFWESGVVGQVLYLEAEASGARATGIGCYFDDPVHGVLGITGNDFQSLYHFTIGSHVDDPRLTTLPAYPDLGTNST